MSGVWEFKGNGVISQVEDPNKSDGGQSSEKKVLVYLPTGQLVSSYPSLERMLRSLGWERYYGENPDILQYHKHSSVDLISLPKDFSKFSTAHMYDIVVKNPGSFLVRDFHRIIHLRPIGL